MVVAARKMPAQRPRRSKQEVATPREFLDAVEQRFGTIVLDLAANKNNAVCDNYFGPGSEVEDAFDVEWGGNGLRWLNPPFGAIGKWAQACVLASAEGAHIAMLVPAAVGSNWFNSYVRDSAYVLELTPRLKFVGHANCYPKDLVLCIYGPERLVGRDTWRWKP